MTKFDDEASHMKRTAQVEMLKAIIDGLHLHRDEVDDVMLHLEHIKSSWYERVSDLFEQRHQSPQRARPATPLPQSPKSNPMRSKSPVPVRMAATAAMMLAAPLLPKL